VMRCPDCGAEFAVVVDMYTTCEPGCGTEAGYQRHRRKGEDPDERCLQAHRDASGAREKARRQRRRVAA
jgi:hypothetical protein